MAVLSCSEWDADLIVTVSAGRFQPQAPIILAASVFPYRLPSIRKAEEHLPQQGLTVNL
jgi:hypothetical protein